MNLRQVILGVSLTATFPVIVFAQGLTPATLLKPPTDAWPTYNGDYSGRRFSTLSQINQSNIKNLNLAWVFRAMPGESPGSIVGGEGAAAQRTGGGTAMDFFANQVKSTPLMVNGILYFATPDNAWAVDARSGRQLWHYFWRTKGGIHVGN